MLATTVKKNAKTRLAYILQIQSLLFN